MWKVTLQDSVQEQAFQLTNVLYLMVNLISARSSCIFGPVDPHSSLEARVGGTRNICLQAVAHMNGLCG